MKSSIFWLSLMALSFESQAFFCSNCATFIQMSQSNLNQTKSYLEQVQQTYHALKNLEYQVQNLRNVKNLHWGDTRSQLNNLNTIAARGQSLSYAMADVTERWNALFIGVEGYQEQSAQNMHSVEAYQTHGDALRDTARSSLELAHQMSQYQKEDQDTLSDIQGNVRNASGAMEIAQAQGELLAQVSQQLQKIQSLMQAQIQMNASYIAHQVDAVERDRVTHEVVTGQETDFDGSGGQDWSTQWHSPPIQWTDK